MKKMLAIVAACVMLFGISLAEKSSQSTDSVPKWGGGSQPIWVIGHGVKCRTLSVAVGPPLNNVTLVACAAPASVPCRCASNSGPIRGRAGATVGYWYICFDSGACP